MADLVRIEGEIARLRDLSLEELRAQWHRQRRSPAPGCFKSDLLFRTLAYQLQVKALGGLDRATERLLDRLADAEDPTAVLASLRRRYFATAGIEQGCRRRKIIVGQNDRVRLIEAHRFGDSRRSILSAEVG